ncbi:TspO protein [Candidatus Peregrinibacteria bacterium CG11_big_fil_rev_8_21_14_0_20_46_8]|nr:MAG: TspO protein [Candidatus Peregrinibacteria bacterium CG11_big_fil_rev_8_21_14_0_20_46_8]
MQDKHRLIIALAVSYLSGLIGSLYTNPSTLWYQELLKPWFQVPGWFFGPVWFVLYGLIGYAVYLVWKNTDVRERTRALTLFGFHLFVSVVWTYLFWQLQNTYFAYIAILLLWLTLIISMQMFWNLNKRAFYLLLPYLAWLSYACMLNYAIWQLNL